MNDKSYTLDYDNKADALFIRFDRKTNYAKSRHNKNSNFVLDISDKDKLIGIEILNTTTMFKMTKEEIMEICKND